MPVASPDQCYKCDGTGQGNEKLRQVYRADGITRLMALAQQRGGHNRTPAAAAHRIHKPAEQRQRSQVFGFARDVIFAERLADHHHAHDEQVNRHERLDDIAVNTGQDVRAGHRANHARQQQPLEKPAVHVAHLQVRQPRNARSKHFGHMDAAARQSRRNAQTQQKRGAGNAVGHAQRTVNNLRQKADQHEK